MALLFFFMSEGDSKKQMQDSDGALLAAGSTAATPYFPRKRKGHESPHSDQIRTKVMIPNVL